MKLPECPGCAGRRAAMTQMATRVVSAAKEIGKRLMPAAPPVDVPRNEDAGRRAISRRK